MFSLIVYERSQTRGFFANQIARFCPFLAQIVRKVKLTHIFLSNASGIPLLQLLIPYKRNDYRIMLFWKKRQIMSDPFQSYLENLSCKILKTSNFFFIWSTLFTLRSSVLILESGEFLSLKWNQFHDLFTRNLIEAKNCFCFHCKRIKTTTD